MRIAVLSDIHSNGEALDAVAAELSRLRPDRIYHLGDVAGYNAEPEKCVRWVMGNAHGGILGNHDAVAAGKASGEFFHAPARAAALWSRTHLTPQGIAYLAGLPDRLSVEGGALLVHGAPSDPDRYLFFLEDAEEEWDGMSGEGAVVVFFGHTHIPAAFVRREDGAVLSLPPREIRLSAGERAMFNPGSVGQPRDRDPRASFLLYDSRTRTASWIRVPYDVAACQKKVIAAGLPRVFAARLADGT